MTAANFKYLALFLISCFVFTGCHFVGDSSAAHGAAGLLGGLWDGSVILFSVVMTCFSDVQVIDPNNIGFLYKVGFAIGVLCFAWNVGIFFGIISVLLYFLPM